LAFSSVLTIIAPAILVAVKAQWQEFPLLDCKKRTEDYIIVALRTKSPFFFRGNNKICKKYFQTFQMQGRFLDIHGFVVFDRRNKRKQKKRMSISNTHLQNEGLDERKN